MAKGIEEARRRIAEEAEARTGALDLSELELDRLPDELAELTHLQRLDCSFTQVSDLTPLQGLESLQSLTCSYTQVSDLTPLQGLESLESLDCSSNPGERSDAAPRLQGLESSETQVERDAAPRKSLLDC